MKNLIILLLSILALTITSCSAEPVTTYDDAGQLVQPVITDIRSVNAVDTNALVVNFIGDIRDIDDYHEFEMYEIEYKDIRYVITTGNDRRVTLLSATSIYE